MFARARRSPSTWLAGAAVAATLAGGAAVPAVAQISAYKTPANGKWKIQDKFEFTAGGSATIGSKGTKITKLTLNPGPDNVEACGAGPVATTKSLTIKRFGSYKRPAVGRLDAKTKVIEQTSATFTVGGQPQKGKVSVLFEKDGKTAFSARVTVGECNLNFALRK